MTDSVSAVHQYCYWVVFYEHLQHPPRRGDPITDADHVSTQAQLATKPHILDRNVVPTLPVLWHVLHLPRSGFDYLQHTADGHMALTELDVASNILVMAERHVMDAGERLAGTRPPDIVFIGDGVDREKIASIGADALALVPFADARAVLLPGHWTLLAARVPAEFREVVEPPSAWTSVMTAPTMLPVQFLARQMGSKTPIDNSDDFRMTAAWTMQSHVFTLARMKEQGISEEEVNLHFCRFFKEHGRKHRVNLVLGAPGVSPFYERDAPGGAVPFRYDTRADGANLPAADNETETVAINYMVTHRALSAAGIGAALPPVPAECFQALADLEDYFALPRREGPGVTRRRYVRPRVVRRHLRRIADGLAPLFRSEDLVRVLHQCKTLTAFSNFPLGLAVLPGATSPLSCMFPISYRPLTPLSRTLIQEGAPPTFGALSLPIRILLVECVDPGDKIYEHGQAVWPVIARQVVRDGFAQFTIEDADSAERVRELVAREQPAILVVSAHGFYDRARNLSGVVIGGKRVLGPELGPMPPLVVLSACHVSPRGVGTISIVDMLLREGATAVLGTHVPVDARWNAILLGRFFTNLRAGATGEVALRSIQDVWQHVLSTNAVHDVLNMSRRVRKWGFEGTVSDRRILVEFQNHRSRGRLRAAHIYEDTERLLQEIADDSGFGDSFRAALSSESYVPESLFYYLAGWPERILVPRHE
jgi:hypothetical protein